MAVNIDDIKFKDGSEMTVLHPVTGEPLVDDEGNKAIITLAGVDSDEYRKASNRITNKRVKNKRNAQLTAERLEADTLDLICACTLGWSGLTFNGDEPKSAEEIYSKAKWIRQQAEEWMHDRANYLGK